MRKYLFFLLLFLIETSTSIYGQEVLLDLQSIPIKEAKVKKTSAQAKSKALLALPFFDDFSKGYSTFDPSNWLDSYVMINHTYALNPPTIGVATFDALDQYGKLYKHLTTLTSPSDTLTSQPINLNLPEIDSIYFSFSYQPKGLGKESQVDDSLVVEFYSNNDSKWVRAWSASAQFSSNSIAENYHLTKKFVTKKATKIAENFFKVLLPLKDQRFLKEGFKFRFINYASLPTNTQVSSLRGNGDQWHIDLVYLDKGRSHTDTLLNDITFSKPIKSFLKNYESIPWKHFTNEAMQSELTNPLAFNMQYTNLGPITWNVTRRFIITDLSYANNPYPFSGGAENIYAFQTFNYSRDYEYALASSWEDSAKYSIEAYLITDIDNSTRHLRWNDTIQYTQKFFNYYAYDDGSAENGYGIYGEGSQNGKVALKYHSYVDDSLIGIFIYFNQVFIDALNPSKVRFILTVWEDNNGKPGNILYQESTLKPGLAYNRDTLYKINEPFMIGGDFWVGFVNTTTDMLNIGFDLNNVHNDKLYYNLTGEWVKSQFEGSLMVKPIFGKFAKGQTGISKPAKQAEFTIFPNPATNQVNLNIPDGTKPENIRIFNLTGQVVLNSVYEGGSINISNLKTGVYLLQLTFKNRAATTKKLVIIK